MAAAERGAHARRQPVAPAQGSRRRSDRTALAGISDARRARRTRSRPFRAALPRWQGSARRRRRGQGGRASRRSTRSLAGTSSGGRPLRAVRQGGSRAPRGAAGAGHRRTRRGRPRSRSGRRPDRRAGATRPRSPSPRAVGRPADARPLPRRASSRGSCRLRVGQTPSRPRARARTGTTVASPSAEDSEPRSEPRTVVSRYTRSIAAEEARTRASCSLRCGCRRRRCRQRRGRDAARREWEGAFETDDRHEPAHRIEPELGEAR